MKNIFALLFALLIIKADFASAGQVPYRGGEETNGGDAIVASFYSILDEIVAFLPEKIQASPKLTIMKKEFQKARDSLLVTSAPAVYIGERELMAVNQPGSNPPKIVISQKFWNTISNREKKLLILHEMLPVMGYDDKAYNLSSEIIRVFPDASNDNLDYDAPALLKTISDCDQNKIEWVTSRQLNYLIRVYSLEKIMHVAAKSACSPLFIRIFNPLIGVNPNTCFKVSDSFGRDKISSSLAFILEDVVKDPSRYAMGSTWASYVESLIYSGADANFKCSAQDISACEHFKLIKDPHFDIGQHSSFRGICDSAAVSFSR